MQWVKNIAIRITELPVIRCKKIKPRNKGYLWVLERYLLAVKRYFLAPGALKHAVQQRGDGQQAAGQYRQRGEATQLAQ